MADESTDEIRSVVQQVAQALEAASETHADELAGRRTIKSLLTTVGRLNEKYPMPTIMLSMWNVLSAMAEEWANAMPTDRTPPKVSFQEVDYQGVPAEYLQGLLNGFAGRRAHIQAFEDGSETIICISEASLTRNQAYVEWEKFLRSKDEDETEEDKE